MAFNVDLGLAFERRPLLHSAHSILELKSTDAFAGCFGGNDVILFCRGQ